MMGELRASLLSDGSSDRAIIPLLERLLHELRPKTIVQIEWADLARLPDPPKQLSERIVRAIELYPCDLLFVHRDAEAESPGDRAEEIDRAVKDAATATPPVVRVIPVRMQEAWLLVDEPAIRRAAGNPSGNEEIDLPPMGRLEDLPDPKEVLYQALRTASGLSGVRRKKFRVRQAVHRVAENIPDLERLRHLSAFQRLEAELAGHLVDLTQ